VLTVIKLPVFNRWTGDFVRFNRAGIIDRFSYMGERYVTHRTPGWNGNVFGRYTVSHLETGAFVCTSLNVHVAWITARVRLQNEGVEKVAAALGRAREVRRGLRF
jgi:hypothetical protein